MKGEVGSDLRVGCGGEGEAAGEKPRSGHILNLSEGRTKGMSRMTAGVWSHQPRWERLCQEQVLHRT